MEFERGLGMKVHNKKNAWKRSTLLMLAVVLVLVMAACGKKDNDDAGDKDNNAAGSTDSKIVATYDGGEVPTADFDDYVRVFGLLNPQYGQMLEIPEIKQQILEMYVNYRIVGDKISDDVSKAAKERVDKHLKEFDELLASDEAFEEQLKDLKREDLEEFMLLEAKVLENFKAKLTDEQLQKTYDALAPNFATISARHILVATQLGTDPEPTRTEEEALERANEVRQKLVDGGDWDELAKEYSDDSGSNEKGGLYEDADARQWVEEFKRAAFEQEIGVVGEPVLGPYGYHVIKVEKRDVTALSDLSEEDKDAVNIQASSELYQQYVTDEIPKLNIKYNLAAPSAAPSEQPTGEPAGEAEASAAPTEEPQETPAASPEATEAAQ